MPGKQGTWTYKTASDKPELERATMRRLSGLMARHATNPLEPWSVAIGSPLAASQRRTTLSQPPEANQRPSGL